MWYVLDGVDLENFSQWHSEIFINKRFVPTYIPQRCCTHPHTLYCFALSQFTLALGRGDDLFFFSGFSLLSSHLPSLIFSFLTHTRTHVHLPEACTKLCLWHSFSKHCSLCSNVIGCWSCDLKERPCRSL